MSSPLGVVDWRHHVVLGAILIPFAVLGDACRVAIMGLTLHGTSHVFVPNMVGSAFLGILRSSPRWKTIAPLSHVGLCVGFCGCFTTFSTWMMILVTPSDWKVIVQEGLLGLFGPICCYCLSAWTWGRIFPSELWTCPQQPSTTNEPASPQVDVFDKCMGRLDSITITVAVVATIAFVVSTSVEYTNNEGLRWSILFASLLAPVGVWPRYALGVALNKKILIPSLGKDLPYGTFLANTLAFILVGILFSLCASQKECVAVSTGVGGALSTVSSWVAETYELRNTRGIAVALLYYFGSVVTGVTVCGAFVWGSQ